MLFKKSKPQTPKGPDSARREIFEAIERNGLGRSVAADMLEGIVDLLRMSIATTTNPNATPPLYIPKPPSKPKAALSALASLIAGKSA